MCNPYLCGFLYCSCMCFCWFRSIFITTGHKLMTYFYLYKIGRLWFLLVYWLFYKTDSYYKKESVNMVSLILFSGKTGFELAF